MKPFILTRQAIPERLRQIPQPPRLLWVLSDNWEDLLARPAVAIVGSRRPTTYGQTITRQLAAELSAQGVVIISGLAYGIDSLAHSGALEAGGLTIAVLPAGLEQIYPSSHAGLARQILAGGGALVSEYDATCQKPQRYQFVARNRLIAGFSRLVIVTEAGYRSGSRHTVDFATEQGRDVAAVPGRIDNPLSAGPHRHLQEGAALITGSQDVLQLLGISSADQAQNRLKNREPTEQRVLDLLSTGVGQPDTLQQQSQLSTSHFRQTMTMLELSGLVVYNKAGQWTLASAAKEYTK
jgi:DNA processing protein